MCPIRIPFRIRISRNKSVHWNNWFAHFEIFDTTATTWKHQRECNHSVKHLFSASAWTRGSISLEVDAALHLVQHLCMSIAFIGIFGISFADHANSCIAVLPLFHFSISTQVQRPSLGKPGCKHSSVLEILVPSVILGSGNLLGLTRRQLASPTCLQKGNHQFLQASKEVVARCWCWLIL